jgi:putative oxidoreductase
MNFLSRFQGPSYAMLRMASGFMFSFHGAQILFGLYSDFHPDLGSQIWIGGVIELVCGLAILFGLKTRLAAFICSGQMAVAYVQFHWKGQWGPKFFPALNQGEPALLYCFLFLYFACQGPGIWALDKKS